MSKQKLNFNKKAALLIAVMLAAYMGEPNGNTPPQKIMILKETKHNAK